jgi:hypothetical protein
MSDSKRRLPFVQVDAESLHERKPFYHRGHRGTQRKLGDLVIWKPNTFPQMKADYTSKLIFQR